MSTTNILITGCKDGIGKGLLETYASRPNHILIAAIRDQPNSKIAQDLVSSVTKLGQGSKIIAIPYDAATQTDQHNAMHHLRNYHADIKHLDVVIANAAINDHWGACHNFKKKEVTDHLAVNTIAPMMLYRDSRPYLLAAPEDRTPKFIFISSVVGSITMGPSIPLEMPILGLCKAAGNYFAAKANGEEKRMVVIPIHPGWVRTKMGNAAAKGVGMEEAPMTLETCIELLSGLIDRASKEQGGKFLQVEGENAPW